jgi:type I restriction enzyme S subunit
MGLKTFTIDFAELKSNDSLRLWVPFFLPDSKFKYEKINNFLSLCESGSRPKGGIKDEDEGEAISLGGEQIGVDGNLDLSKIPYVSFDFYDNSTKGKVQDNDILICKDGALTGKTCWVEFSLFPSSQVMVNEHVYILRGNSEINQKFLFYYTTTDLFQSQIKDLAYKKKAQPGLNLDHFKKIKIPLIPQETQDKIVAQIEPIENRIKELKDEIENPQEVINMVFAREFGFDLEQFEENKKKRFFELDFSKILNNNLVRLSTHFHHIKLDSFEDKLRDKDYWIPLDSKFKLSGGKRIPKGETFSNYITDYYYLRPTEVNLWGIEKNDTLYISKELYNRLKRYSITTGEFCISIVGTLGKTALINTEELGIGDENLILSENFIKLTPTQAINELFYYYYFYSFIFEAQIDREYTITSIKKLGIDKWNYIKIPNISLERQQKIVDEIKSELDKQEAIKKKIEKERNKIDEIIKKAIK